MKKRHQSVRKSPLLPVRTVYVGFNRPPHREIVSAVKALKERFDGLGISMVLPGARTPETILESRVADGYWRVGFGDASVLLYHQNSADIDLCVQMTQIAGVGIPLRFFCFRRSVCAPTEIIDVVRALNIAFEDDTVGVGSVVSWVTGLRL